MIYFSAVPVRLDSVDEEQYRALRAFKGELRRRGLYAEYDSIEEFREKLSRQLAQTVLHRFAPKKTARTTTSTLNLTLSQSLPGFQLFPSRPTTAGRSR